MEHPLEPLLGAIHKVGEKIADSVVRLVKLVEGIYEQIRRGVQEIVEHLGKITEALFEVQIISNISKMDSLKRRLQEEENIIKEIEANALEELNQLEEKFEQEAQKLLKKRNENIYNLCRHIFHILDNEALFVEDKLINDLVFTSTFEDAVSEYILSLEEESINKFKEMIQKQLDKFSTHHEKTTAVLQDSSKDDLKDIIKNPEILLIPIVEKIDREKEFYLFQTTDDKKIFHTIAKKDTLDSLTFPEKFPEDMLPVDFALIKKYLIKIAPKLKDSDFDIIKKAYEENPWHISKKGVLV